MLAYSAQELLVEPYAGLVFGLSPGVTTKLAGLQHGGSLAGMIVVAICASALGGPRLGDLRLWTVGGCLASASALAAVAVTGLIGAGPGPLRAAVFALGFGNGVYAAAAIGTMMGLAAKGARAGTRMGLWGAAQALALGAGGLLASALVDLARLALGSPLNAYVVVFAAEALAFVASAWIAARLGEASAAKPRATAAAAGMAPQES